MRGTATAISPPPPFPPSRSPFFRSRTCGGAGTVLCLTSCPSCPSMFPFLSEGRTWIDRMDRMRQEAAQDDLSECHRRNQPLDLCALKACSCGASRDVGDVCGEPAGTPMARGNDRARQSGVAHAAPCFTVGLGTSGPCGRRAAEFEESCSIDGTMRSDGEGSCDLGGCPGRCRCALISPVVFQLHEVRGMRWADSPSVVYHGAEDGVPLRVAAGAVAPWYEMPSIGVAA